MKPRSFSERLVVNLVELHKNLQKRNENSVNCQTGADFTGADGLDFEFASKSPRSSKMRSLFDIRKVPQGSFWEKN